VEKASLEDVSEGEDDFQEISICEVKTLSQAILRRVPEGILTSGHQ